VTTAIPGGRKYGVKFFFHQIFKALSAPDKIFPDHKAGTTGPELLLFSGCFMILMAPAMLVPAP
jgi:hypothetical protein